MKRLILMRHAKSDWFTDAAEDYDRPLNDRGRRDAPRIGKWLRDNDYLPDMVLCSSAARTRETLALTGIEAETEFMPSLYHAPANRMLDILRYDAKDDTVMLIGHNPGISGFAQNILASPPADRKFYQYPTAATLIADFDLNDWSDVNWGTAQLVDFVYPKALPG